MELSSQLQTIQKQINKLEEKIKELRHTNTRLSLENKKLREQTIRENTLNGNTPQEIPAPPPHKIFYKIGQRFRYVDPDGCLSRDTYLFAQTGFDGCNLIGLQSGNRWCAPKKFASNSSVEKGEFDTHFNSPNATKWVLQP